MKIYTIIAGVNGTGKTSLTGVLKSQRNDLGHIINVDKLAIKNNNNFPLAAKQAIKKINELLTNNISFTQETTLAGHTIRNTIIKASLKGYTIRLFYIGLNTSNESIKRIANRVSKGGHNVPLEDVIRRFNSRFESLLSILPYCNETHFYDNENGFIEVAEYKNGELTLKEDYKPNWLNELIKKLNAE